MTCHHAQKKGRKYFSLLNVPIYALKVNFFISLLFDFKKLSKLKNQNLQNNFSRFSIQAEFQVELQNVPDLKYPNRFLVDLIFQCTYNLEFQSLPISYNAIIICKKISENLPFTIFFVLHGDNSQQRNLSRLLSFSESFFRRLFQKKMQNFSTNRKVQSCVSFLPKSF